MQTISAIDTAILIDISGIDEPTIYEYFTKLNHGEFTATAELFAAQGSLNPPFGNSIEGRDAIAKYLAAEAKGMRFCPESGKVLISIDPAAAVENPTHTQYQIQGKVEINWFTVNVSWSIQLNAAKEIMLLEVKLLTAVDDLLSFSRI